ncbi:hypothetical protein LINPERHAP1_LOCUS22687 [Linum perenne]
MFAAVEAPAILGIHVESRRSKKLLEVERKFSTVSTYTLPAEDVVAVDEDAASRIQRLTKDMISKIPMNYAHVSLQEIAVVKELDL